MLLKWADEHDQKFGTDLLEKYTQLIDQHFDQLVSRRRSRDIG